MGATINAILLTRAPLLVPLTSFQSAIIVWFVERREQGLRALGIPFSAVIGVGVVGAAAAWIVADPIVRIIYGDEFGLPGAVFAGLTEASVGTEVQRLVDTGTIQPMTSFDAAQCQQEQGITESILIMEEVSWGGEDTTGWLLVHGPVDRETLRANGGIISATVVLPTCGTGAHDEERLAEGHRERHDQAGRSEETRSRYAATTSVARGSAAMGCSASPARATCSTTPTVRSRLNGPSRCTLSARLPPSTSSIAIQRCPSDSPRS